MNCGNVRQQPSLCVPGKCTSSLIFGTYMRQGFCHKDEVLHKASHVPELNRHTSSPSAPLLLLCFLSEYSKCRQVVRREVGSKRSIKTQTRKRKGLAVQLRMSATPTTMQPTSKPHERQSATLSTMGKRSNLSLGHKSMILTRSIWPSIVTQKRPPSPSV